MLVDINLIEIKKRKPVFFIILGSIFFIFLLLWVLLILFYQSLYHQNANIQNQLKQAEQLRATKVNNTDNNEKIEAVESLKNAVNWAQNYPISTAELLKNITSILPERGYVVMMNLSSGNTLLLNVKFETSKEAAFYLGNLEKAKFIKEVTLNSVTSEDVQNESGNLTHYIAQYTITLNKNNLKKGQD